MNTIFKIMAFSLVFNFAIGIMLTAIPAFDVNANAKGLVYDSSYSDGFTTVLETDINPSSTLEDKGNEIYRVLDMMNLGFIQKFLQTVTQYTHGFIKFLDVLFGDSMDTQTRSLLFGNGLGILYHLMTIGYILGAWTMWTGKDLTGPNS